MNDELKSEIACIEQAKVDVKYFEPLYEKYYASIVKFAYQRLETLEEAYEITSNVFASALFNIHQYRHQGFPFSSWLYRIAINEINKHYKKLKKKRCISINAMAFKQIAEVTNTRDGNAHKELNDTLKLALQYLKLEEIELIELRYFEERSFAEVALIMGITENNAKVKVYRIIDKLKIIFSKLS